MLYDLSIFLEDKSLSCLVQEIFNCITLFGSNEFITNNNYMCETKNMGVSQMF